MSKVRISTAAKQAIKIYLSLFRYWKILLAVHVVSYLGTEALSWEQDRVLSSGREDLMPIFLVFSGSIVAEIFFTTAWVVVVAHAIRQLLSNSKFESHFIEDFNSALVEATRSLARVLRWLPVFILPAFVKFIRLSFVPFVVIDQPAYKRGEVDALNESERLAKRHFWKVLLVLILTLALPSLPSIAFQSENISLASRPLLSITWSVFEFFASLISTAFLFCFYRELKNAYL